MNKISITAVKFINYKGLKDYSVSLQDMNVLVGPNNSGKSTVISAFRLLDSAMKIARSRSAAIIKNHEGRKELGYSVSENNVPFSMENLHFNYEEVDARIEFSFSNKNKLFLFFPHDGGFYFYCDAQGVQIKSPAIFKKNYPYLMQVIPVLGPLEHEEKIVSDETVKKNIGTPRASRNFRNYWNKNPEGFDKFKEMLERTWHGMSIKKPEIASVLEQRLVMFCSEERHDREIFWAGFGFQIWCQILTYLSREDKFDLIIVDEPEVYLHPDIQRQLLGLLRDMDSDVLIATHSVEILGESEPSEIVLVDKKNKSAKRLKDIEEVQLALDVIGSIQNITLTQLAKTHRVLFVEGMKDYKVIKRFAKSLNYHEVSSGVGLTAFESGGYSSWDKVKSLAWGIENTFGADFKIAAIYDHDYWCEEEIKDTLNKLNEHLSFAHIHERKEIENYLLDVKVLQRSIVKAIQERSRRTSIDIDFSEKIDNILEGITNSHKVEFQSQYIAKYIFFHKKINPSIDDSTLTIQAIKKFEREWQELGKRLEVVGGKIVLKELRTYLADKYQVNLTDAKIIDEYRKDEVPQDMVCLIVKIDEFRNK